jgi:hypothetical protein
MDCVEEQQFGCFSSSKCPKEEAPNFDRLGAFIFSANLQAFIKSPNLQATLL